MKIKTLTVLLVSFIFLAYFASCDSSGYESEDVEVYEDSSNITHNTEIKQEIEQPKPEIKNETTITVTPPKVKYTIQIGAFEVESNARDFFEKAKSITSYELYIKQIKGLYKIRTGFFDTLEEAVPVLYKIQDAGFKDSFITEAE